MRRSEKWLLAVAACGLVLAAAFAVVYATSQRRLEVQRARLARPDVMHVYEAVHEEAPVASGIPAQSSEPAPELRTFRDRAEAFDRLFRATAFTANDPVFAEATKALGGPQEEWPEGMLETLRQLAALVQPHLDELRTLVAVGGPMFALDFARGPAMELPHLAPMRNLARLLAADATVAQLDGDTDRVVVDLDAILGLGDALAAEPLLISQLVRIAIVSVGYDAMRILPKVGLTPDQTALLMAHLARADHRDGFACAFAGEAAMMEVVFESPADAGIYADPASPVAYAWARIYRSGAAAPLRAADESTALEILGQIQEIGALPLFEARPQLEAVDQRIEGLSQFLHPYSLMMLPSLTRAGEAQARHEAMLDLAQLGLAVEQFHAETGAFPQSLAEIADRLADGDPADPFTGKLYAYRTTDGGFLLYSVGRNLIDDGGVHDLREGDIVWRGAVQPRVD